MSELPNLDHVDDLERGDHDPGDAPEPEASPPWVPGPPRVDTL
jgi:hypothetical protein